MTPSRPGAVPATTPYPWPFDTDLDPARAALVLTGWDETWWRRVVSPGTVVGPVERLAARIGAAGLVVAVTHRPPVVPARLAAPAGVGGPPPVAGAVPVVAAGIDAFHGSPLDAVLRAAGCDHLYLAGCGLETTVHSTMRSANDRGYECLLVLDACAPLDPGTVPRAVSMVEMSGGIFGAVGTSDNVLAALDAASAKEELP